jgi:pyridoxal phosphate enzyme (YggS family)
VLTTDFAANVAAVRERMERALARANRPSGSVRLVAVTKTHPADVAAAAVEAGLNDLGENRVEEALPKIKALGADKGVRWHMIGHIQSRKARSVVEGGFALVHSVDALKLAERLSSLSVEAGRRLPVLLECNVSGEASKAGFRADTPKAVETLLPELAQVTSLPGLELRGLMTMAPIVPEPDAARPYFARLRSLRDTLAEHFPAVTWAELSMGMTDDFEAAILEGATLIRVGRALFGERS